MIARLKEQREANLMVM